MFHAAFICLAQKIINNIVTRLSYCSVIERAKGDKKKKKKKPTSSIQLVELQKPEIYELVDHSVEGGMGHGHGHGGHMGHGGGHMGHGGGHGGGGHGHGGHGQKLKKKHGRSIGGWLWAVARIR